MHDLIGCFLFLGLKYNIMMDQHQKLRLKVTTNTGLNLMCTVNKSWTVEQLYPHITKLYKEVTEDQ